MSWATTRNPSAPRSRAPTATSRRTPSTWPTRAPTPWSARSSSCSRRRKAVTSGTSTRRSAASISRRRSSGSATSAARRSTSSAWTRCPTPASASSARPRRKMVSGANRSFFWVVAPGVVVLDFLTKRLAVATPAHRPVPLAGDWLSFQLVYNPGAAFGIHVGGYSRWVFMALAIVALVVLGSMVRQTDRSQPARLVGLGLGGGGEGSPPPLPPYAVLPR